MLRANTHIHIPPNFSSFRSIEEAVSLAAAEGIEMLGASNYYDHSVYRDFRTACEERGIRPLFGIEIVCRLDPDAWAAGRGASGLINDPANPGKLYLCGKALRHWEQPTERAATLLAKIRGGDEQRMARMTEALVGVARDRGVTLDLTADSIRETVAARAGVAKATVTLQERHLAEAVQESVFATGSTEALIGVDLADPTRAQAEIRNQLMKAGKPAFVEEEFVFFEEAVELIRELGGIVSYPIVDDGMSPRSPFEMNVIDNLKGLGIEWVEFIPNRNSPGALAETATNLARAGFHITAGTEHNTTDRPPVRPQCKDGSAIETAIADLFTAGAVALSEWQS